MKFNGIRCDECSKIRGEANHWVEVQVWKAGDHLVVGLGEKADLMIAVSDMSSATRETHDLCGQQCALKHVARLLGWSE